jgi:hypothetical protein
MNRALKIGWINMGIVIVSLVAAGTGVLIMFFKFGFPRAWSGLSLGWICVLTVVPALIYRKQKEGNILFDERDEIYDLKSALVAFSLGWAYFIFILTLMIFITGPEGRVNNRWFGVVIMFGYIMAALSHSLALLVYYHRDRSDVGN